MDQLETEPTISSYSAFVECLHSPACLVTPDMSLYGQSRLLHPQVLFASEPAADSLLDANTSITQLVKTKLLQVRHLTSPEEDLVFAKLILLLVLGNKQKIH